MRGRVLDLRLLLPVLAAWSACALALSRPVALVLLVAAGCASAATLLAWRGSGRSGQGRSGQGRSGQGRSGQGRSGQGRSGQGRSGQGGSGQGGSRGGRWGQLPQLGLGAVALVLVATAGHAEVRATGPLPRLAAEHAVVTVEGVVASDPVLLRGRGVDDAVVRLTLRVQSVTGRGTRAAVHTPVLVSGSEAWQSVRWRERVRVTGKLAPAEPGDDVVAVLRARGAPAPLAAPGPVARGAEHLRAGLRGAASPLPDDARGLLPALVIGDTSRTPPDLTDAMLATGMTHLSAVSGSNVAIVLAFALGGCALCGVPRRWRPPVAAVVLAGFVVLARPEPSVIRAATMGAIGLIGASRSRRSAGVPVLSGAVLVLLCVDPWLSRSYGFALSTLATLGLLLFVRSWGDAIGTVLPARLRSWGPAIAIPLAAQAMCAPVVVLLQGSVSVVGILANLLAAPLVAPATVAGVAAAAVAPVWPFAGTVLCWVGAVPALGIAWVARTCATIPGGTLPWPDGAVGAVLLAVVTAVVLVTGAWWTDWARRHPVCALGVCLLVTASAAPTSSATWPPPGWRFVACDVGQGDGLVLATTPGHAVLVDAGPDPTLIDQCLTRLGVRVLDSVVLTHFHADHVDGLAGAISGRGVREILASPVRDPPQQWAEVERLAGAAGIPIRDVAAGDHLDWKGVSADVWWPARRIAAGSVPNNASVVLAVRSADLDLLLWGDVEREAGHAVLLRLRRDPGMAARGFDVVKAPHHGSANLDEDVMVLTPAPLAVVSVGRDNDYGHPSAKALEVLRRHGSAVVRTDQRGDVAVLSVDGQVAVTWRRR